MSFRIILAITAGVGTALIAVVSYALVQSGSEGGPVAMPSVQADRGVPESGQGVMDVVTVPESGRRATLHQEMGAATLAQDPEASFVARPVIASVREASDDALSLALFGENDRFAMPDPATILAPAAFQPEPEPEPEPEPDPVPVTMPPIDEALRDSLRLDLPPRTYRFEVVPIHEESSVGDRLLRGLDGLLGLAVGTAHADGWTGGAPQHAAPHPDIVSTDPVVRLRAPAGVLHTPPARSERSAARPELVGIAPDGAAYSTGGGADVLAAGIPGGRQVLARAGDLVYARLLYGLNSDDITTRPIFARLTDILPSGAYGPLHGARVRGGVSFTRDNAAVTFDTILLPDGRQIPMAGIAVSPDADRAGIAADVDRHRLQRYGSLFLAGLLQGVGEVAQASVLGDSASPRTVIVTGEGDVDLGDDDDLETREILLGSLAPVGSNISAEIQRAGSRPPTISAPAGHIFGVVIVDTLIYDPVAQAAQGAFNPRTGTVETLSRPVEPALPAAAADGGPPSDASQALGFDAPQRATGTVPRPGEPLPGALFEDGG